MFADVTLIFFQMKTVNKVLHLLNRIVSTIMIFLMGFRYKNFKFLYKSSLLIMKDNVTHI